MEFSQPHNHIAIVGLGTYGCKIVHDLRSFDLQLWRRVDCYCIDSADVLDFKRENEMQWKILPNLIQRPWHLLQSHESKAVCNIPIPAHEQLSKLHTGFTNKEFVKLEGRLKRSLKNYRMAIVVGGLGGETTSCLVCLANIVIQGEYRHRQ